MVETLSQASMPSASAPFPERTLRLGTRGSRLALIQTEYVISLLRERHPLLQAEAHVVSVQGDRDKQTPLAILGGQGIFAKEIHNAVLDGTVDGAVHCIKDLMSTLPDGIVIGAMLDRADARDVLISAHPGGLADLPQGARVGTSSRRRIAQLRLARPDITPVELRGNVDTRLSKVAAGGQLDGAIIAAAGLERMGLTDRIAEYLSLDTFIPAPGQAALAVDSRADNAPMLALLADIADPVVTATATVERTFLRTVGGGCRSPLAAHATIEGDMLTLRTMAASEDLARIGMFIETVPVADGERLAEDMAARYLADILA